MPRAALYTLVLASGLAGLTWEVLWQHHASLALGVSAGGTAITLACTMGGLAIGSWGMGAWLRRRRVRALRAYAVLEVVVGLAGALLAAGFGLVSTIDTAVWRQSPALAPAVQVLCVALALGPPTIAMGATVPLFRVLAPAHRTSVARLYALNTAGAALGVLGAAFLLLPALGVDLTAALASVLNLAVAVVAWLAAGPVSTGAGEGDTAAPGWARAVAFATGFATFALEVAWFRSLRAAFQSTTDSFALILFAVLLPLAIGARLAVALGTERRTLARTLLVAGVAVLLAAPLVERFDAVALWGQGYWSRTGLRAGLSLLVLGPPVLVIGVALPWLLERQPDARAVGQLYAFNTLGAVAGSLLAAWVVLPGLGATRTAWLVGVGLGATALFVGAPVRRAVPALVVALAVAFVTESGVGRLRVQGAHLADHTVLASREGPDATVSVIAHQGGVRELVIDGFQTSGEAQTGHYMRWMGHLPPLLHPNPRDGLVICFGTGQTANAVRREGLGHVDIVDVSEAVLGLAPLFPSNEGVLDAPGVETHVMDGRAWLRRTQRRYDVVTLEPMAPTFAGTNALYSRRFYELMAARLRPGAVVAQWLPFHIVTLEESVAIAATFTAVFPDAALWIDPHDHTGILLGRHGLPPDTPWRWPGLARPGVRDLAPAAVRSALRLTGDAMTRYATLGEVVTDDNQLLAYGSGRRDIWRYGSNDTAHEANLHLVSRVANQRAGRGIPGRGGRPGSR